MSEYDRSSSMPWRIMHISTRLILGGSQENTVLSCEGQVRKGHAVSLVFGPIYGPEGSLLQRVRDFNADGRGIETIETPRLVRELALVKDWRCYHDLRRLIRDWQPDVVHTHSSKAGIIGRMAAWKERVPAVIHTIHGLPFHPYEKKWRNAIYIASERYAARRCHRILCVADAMRDQALAVGIGRPEQYETVYSGMETASFLHPRWSRDEVRRALGIRDDEFVLGTIARLAELKGHDDLLDALAPVMRSRPNVRLLWVGDGWWRARLEERIASLGLRGRVLLTGLVPSDEVPRYLQAMDSLAHPSYREGLPRTVPQALLSGVPVIAYDVDGTSEVCRPGETGLLILPGDARQLAQGVEWLIDHPTERKAMGERGRALCADRFSAERMVEHLESVYASVLASSSDDSAHRPAERAVDP